MAGLWCWAFGRAARLHLAPWLPAALALGTWLFYVADRLLDAWTSPPSELQERHRFHHRHRRVFLAVAAPVALMTGWLVAHMPLSLLMGYAVLGILSLLYLGVVHLPLRIRRTQLPILRVAFFSKELAVALLFAAATALPGWDEARRIAAGMPRHHPLQLLCPLFAALCWLNCMAIEDWEHQRSRGRVALTALLVATTASLSLLELVSVPARWLALCVALSALLFLLLDRSPLGAGGRRIAADLVLLTPLLLLVRS